jgi:xanthine/uracil permease
MGVFSKFAAAIVAIPSPVLGGMTTFLFSAVAVSGVRIISTVPFTRRNRFILTAAFSIGFGESYHSAGSESLVTDIPQVRLLSQIGSPTFSHILVPIRP